MQSAVCWIYKSPRRDGMYLYVPADRAFDSVPGDLLEHFGNPCFVMTLQLTDHRRLARASAEEVLSQLDEQGYYLQMPPSGAKIHAAEYG